MYPPASSIQLDYRPSSFFLPSPAHLIDRYEATHEQRSTCAQPREHDHDRSLRLEEEPQKGSLLGHWDRPAIGLRTPPSEEMSTTYQMPNMASYDTSSLHRSSYTSKAGHADRPRGALSDSMYNGASYSGDQGYSQQQPPHQQPATSYQQPPAGQSRSRAPDSQLSTRSSTPSSAKSAQSRSDASTAQRDAAMVMHSLQIPTCISPKGGDLADFTAQIACLFWFESRKTLEAAENVDSLLPNAPIPALSKNALPLPHFKKWLHTVLSTTQVTQNVIILALMYIYRLKIKNSTVKGQAGSEYRLLTVALMLGNKFLDDNTYTNKTWAEVSGILVTEIHVMEVEFLSNMRYGLLASKEEWEEWLVKLSKFWRYCERAQRPAPSPLVLPPAGYNSSFASPLPSPTGPLQLTPSRHHTPQSQHAYSPSSNNAANGTWPAVYQASNATSPLALKPTLQNYRKRSFVDDDPTEPAPKRITRQPVSGQAPQQLPSQGLPYPIPEDQTRRFVPPTTAGLEPTRLPVPSLSLNTNPQALPSAPTQAPGGPYTAHQPSALSLPPLVHGVRAMSTVFPPSSAAFAPQLLVLGSSGASVPALSAPSINPTASFTPSTYDGTPTKRLSPQGALTPAGTYASSPMTDPFSNTVTPMGSMAGNSGVRTPISNSPSVYLQQRNSPYKPVRRVNTLLYPPPSAFLSEYHISNAIPPTQMHYQPIGRRNEFRTGVVPEFVMERSNGVFNPVQQQQQPAPQQVHGLPPVSSQAMHAMQQPSQRQGQMPPHYDHGSNQYGSAQFR